MLSSSRFAGLLLKAVQQVWLPVLLVGAWYYFSANSTSFYFPPLHDILAVLWRDLSNGILITDMAVSLGNVALGLAISIVFGVAAGLAIGNAELIRIILWPILNFIRAVPPVAVVPMVLVTLGIGVAPKVAIIVFASIWPIMLNTIDGVRGTKSAIIETSKAYRIPTHLYIGKVLLPAAMPQIMAGIRVALSISLVVMVISEFFAADTGLGFYIKDASEKFATRNAWAGTVLVGIIGYVLSAGFLMFEHRVLSWYFENPRRKTAKHKGVVDQDGEAAPIS